MPTLNKVAGKVSGEDRRTFEQLGGFKHVELVVNEILTKHGFLRGMFPAEERSQYLRPQSSPTTQLIFEFDPEKSVRWHFADLIEQAHEVQKHGGGTNYVGAMLQHLVGAKLDLIIGPDKVEHHGFAVADHSTERKGDFHVGSAAIHVTTHPSEALVRKCGDNLRDGFTPVIVTIGDGVTGATFLLKNAGLTDRVDVLDGLQFLTANVLEHSSFSAAKCKVTLKSILARYNGIVGACETDPSLLIRLPGA
jgi:hypothetical protein